ncbi:MAG: hypothetical protein K1060chlam4_00070 [Candidatus Anoxychlamydiales bacterium]|nr:hypothetical protein [Candidatus Anoxychlamydiales bacterium]
MGNTLIQNLDISPAKPPTSKSSGVGIDTIIKAMNKVMLQETSLMLTFAKLINNLNKDLLEYSKESAAASDAAAVSTKRDGLVNQFLGMTGAMGAISFISYEEVENPGRFRKLISGHANMFAGGYRFHIMIASTMLANLLKMNFAINKGKLASQTLEIQADTEKCTMLIAILKERFDDNIKTLKTMSDTIKEIIEKDYNSKAKKLYFYNKK